MKLNPTQLSALSQLLDDALSLAPAQHQAWLAGLPAWHQALKPTLQRLLDPRPHGAASTLALPRIGHSTAAPDDVKAGQSVGPYRLLQPIGAGGMAVVWSAVAPDCMDRRRLAVKLPRADGVDPERVDRLACEADILGGLAHPNIVQLHGAGRSAEGLPYLAMEYVAGQPITTWCRERRAGLAQRLALFLQLVDAVQHVHGRGFVHHDLKPANVLVDDFARVRLLDFGIASRIAGPGVELAAHGRTQPRACTPVYASPEQIDGGPVGRLADVYALGVVLHELITGMRPLGAGPDPWLPMPTALQRIVWRAMAPMPQDRYDGVARLAQELRCLMAAPIGDRLGRTVSATCPDCDDVLRLSDRRRHRLDRPLRLPRSSLMNNLCRPIADAWRNRNRNRNRSRDHIRMRNPMRSFVLLSMALAQAAFSAGCGGGGDDDAAASDGTTRPPINCNVDRRACI